MLEVFLFLWMSAPELLESKELFVLSVSFISFPFTSFPFLLPGNTTVYYWILNKITVEERAYLAKGPPSLFHLQAILSLPLFPFHLFCSPWPRPLSSPSAFPWCGFLKMLITPSCFLCWEYFYLSSHHSLHWGEGHIQGQSWGCPVLRLFLFAADSIAVI